MNQDDFRKLCREASVKLGRDNPDELGETNIIELDDVRMGLFFEAEIAPDRILCYIDIGKPPVVDREAILERVLALNLLTATKTAGVYAFDQQSDTLVFVQHLLFPELLTGDILAEILQGYSAHASSLKQNLLDPSNLRPVHEMLVQSLERNAHGLA